MAVADEIDEIQEVNAICILMDNLQQASTSDTQTDKAPVYDSDGSAEVHHYEHCYDNKIFNMFTQEEQYTELLNPITEPHMVQQNNCNVISVESSVKHNRGTIEQHPTTVEETCAYFESLLDHLRVTAAQVCVTAAKLNYYCSKIKTAERVSTVRERIKTEERIKIVWRSRLLM
ncbi:hypothetical protein Tco_0062451 [Tanacetum coccineum]